MEKSDLRLHFKELRRQFQASKAEFLRANKALNKNLKALLKELCLKDQPVLAYMGYGSEPQIELEVERRWALPRISKDFTMRFFEYFKGSRLEKNEYGIFEPVVDEASSVSPQLASAVVVPGLAFDQNGNRLGLGKGFYDRFLSTNPGLPRIGVGFSFQFSNKNLPITPLDQSMDWLITEKRVMRFKRKEKGS